MTPAAPATPADRRHPIPLDAGWRFVGDGVMGGISSGALSRETWHGREALLLRGRVRTEFNGGFVQMTRDLTPPPGDWHGLELELAGNGRDYGVHLRTTRLVAPWQAWRARVRTGTDWQHVQLPWTAFVPYRFDDHLDPREVRRIGLVALAFDGAPFDAELALAHAAWFR